MSATNTTATSIATTYTDTPVLYRLGWICPVCSKVLWKPPKLYRGERFHRADCPRPLIRCRVLWTATP